MTLEHTCFVYGTLTDPARVAAVLGTAETADRGEATLHGLHRVDGEYPTLAPGGTVAGRLLAVDEAGLDALDDYEGVDRGLYVRVSLPCRHPATESDIAWTYVGDPNRLGAEANWPGDGPFDERVRAALAEADVRVAPRHDTSPE